MTEFDQGYQDAIKALKDQLQGKSSDNQSSSSSSNNVDSQGNPQQVPQLNDSDQKEADKNRQSQSSRGSGNQGVVRPEDCVGSFGNDQPDIAGTFADRAEGKKLAEQEGYDDNQPGDEGVAKEWKEQSLKNKDKLRGNAAGSTIAKIESIWNTTTDWKKVLRDIIGRAINDEERRSAYANKNVLVSQDRIARTDKDRYDTIEYMTAFIDSSGSMSDYQLQLVLAEIYNIALKKKPLRFMVAQCDTRIQDIKEYKTPQEIRRDFKTATVKGRGGTELKPCWDLLLKDPKYSKRPSELAVVFTDGHLTQYKRNPRTMKYLVWVILDNPSFKLEYPEPRTRVLYLKTSDVK